MLEFFDNKKGHLHVYKMSRTTWVVLLMIAFVTVYSVFSQSTNSKSFFPLSICGKINRHSILAKITKIIHKIAYFRYKFNLIFIL